MPVEIHFLNHSLTLLELCAEALYLLVSRRRLRVGRPMPLLSRDFLSQALDLCPQLADDAVVGVLVDDCIRLDSLRSRRVLHHNNTPTNPHTHPHTHTHTRARAHTHTPRDRASEREKTQETTRLAGAESIEEKDKAVERIE